MTIVGAFDAYIIDEQDKREWAELETQLTEKLNAFCDANGLPHESADELALLDGITKEQRDWLKAFIDEWDNEEKA